ncbi:MAG: hypothetical protein PHO94_11325 [Petrimonas sp.]|nr:hypothetical protein [Petrimonas sp.]
MIVPTVRPARTTKARLEYMGSVIRGSIPNMVVADTMTTGFVRY